MKGKHIGAFTNAWRGRRVLIFEDNADPTMVYTSGVPIAGAGDTTETHEPRALYVPYIGSFGKVYR